MMPQTKARNRERFRTLLMFEAGVKYPCRDEGRAKHNRTSGLDEDPSSNCQYKCYMASALLPIAILQGIETIVE